MSALVFLIDTLFSLYLMVVLLRIWLQLARADFYNPFSQFIVKVTHPVVGPLRKVIPSIGRLDTASLVFAFIIAALKILVLQYMQWNALPGIVPVVIASLYMLVYEALQLMFYVIIIRAILSWVSQGQNPIEYLMHQLTEPLIAPVRRFIPPIGGLDLSPLVVLLALGAIMRLL